MPQPNVICIAIDRLSAGYLGAYGNTWVSTPAIDRLTAQSFVLDRAVIDSPQLDLIYRSLWLGLHALCPAEFESQRESLPLIFSRAGWHTALITDESSVANHPLASAFAERILIEQEAANSGDERNRAQVTATASETNLAEFLASAEKWL